MTDEQNKTAPHAAATALGQSNVINTVIIAVRTAIRNKQVLIYYFN